MSNTVKWVLVAAVALGAIYLVMQRGGKPFSLAPTNRLTPRAPAPGTAGSNTRYVDNAYGLGAAALDAGAKVFTTYLSQPSSPKYTGDAATFSSSSAAADNYDSRVLDSETDVAFADG